MVIATARSAPRGSSHPLPLQGDCGSERLSNLPSAILWASGHPIRNYSVCKVPPPSSPAGGPGSRRRGQPSLPSHLRDWRARHPSPPPPARGRIQTESDLKAEPGVSGWPLRQADTHLSRSHTLSPRSVGRATPAARSSPLFSPRSGARTGCLPLSSQQVRLACAARSAQPRLGSVLRRCRLPHPPILSHPLAALRTPGGE